MPSLSNERRNDLETVVKKARVIAERGAKSALEALTVHEARSGNHLDAAGQNLRKRLRAHAKQLGDVRKPNSEQAIGRLIRECAYEHWHRMLFARFLAENDLLIHPEHNVSVSLDDVLELAREQKIDQWELASRFAQRMLPQIFRPDDPVLAVALPRERTLELEQLLESLPTETFKADDSLGWVYQFWQAEEKDRVNASGEKITGETLPAVTQLFTEHYMVLFLLHNTVGAWWAGKRIANGVERIADAATEADARAAVAMPDYQFEYLRFVREPREGDAEGKPTGPWRPAAGTFDGWPRAAKDLKVLDPCCGSGHFLVAVFELLVRLRMAEETLSLESAIRAVLGDNLFGLELDARCTQIAAFNLALAAWRLLRRPIELPTLNIACSGTGPHATEAEWLRLAEQLDMSMPRLGREPVKNGLLNLHHLFSQAATLGSLIDPSELPGDLIAADYETLRPYLAAALAAEQPDEETHERAVAAAGMAKAAELLAGEYTLVITNVPYLSRKSHDTLLKSWADKHTPLAKAELATMFVWRCFSLLARGGTSAVVSPQNWLFLQRYTPLRERWLDHETWHFLVGLGDGAFSGISGAVVNVSMLAASRAEPTDTQEIACLDVASEPTVQTKISAMITRPVRLIRQSSQRANPDARFSFEEISKGQSLSTIADTAGGMCTFDNLRFILSFWEIEHCGSTWKLAQASIDRTGLYEGRTDVVRWEEGNGDLYELVRKMEEDGYKSGIWRAGIQVWGQCGVLVRLMGALPCTVYSGYPFNNNTGVLIPKREADLPMLWAYCSSEQYVRDVRQLDRKMNVTNATLSKVSFDVEHWRSVAAAQFAGGLPAPECDEPSQWLFHGCPESTTEPLQVAVARLLGYRWPPEIDEEIQLNERARKLKAHNADLSQFADDDGIVCVPPVRGERSAVDRLLAILSACGIKPDRDLDSWLRESYFDEHCDLFHNRPFIWHIWDGRKDGFHALVNYHKLAAPGDAGRRLLTALTHSYLGDWIRDQKDQVSDGKPGAEARLTAALDLKAELEKILAGEPPYDIFVRWKPLREQPIGWEPDINDGVRLNIRPFLMAKDVGRKGAGVLRCKPNIKWDKDRGKEPQSLRPKADFPWFWSCDPEKHPAHRTNFAGGTEFDGNRWNDLHYTTAFKQAARDRNDGKGK